MVSFEYRDLLVSVWTDETPGFFRARAEEEFGRATPSARIYIPFDDQAFIRCADRIEELNPRELHYVGARLFDAVFQGEILRLYGHLVEQIRNTGAKLRVRLKLDPPIVSRLPWECLYDTRNGMFLGACPDVTVVRYVEPKDQEPAAVPVRPPLRVLLAADAVPGEARDPSAAEATIVRAALSELEAAGAVAVSEAGRAFGADPLTLAGLSRQLAQGVDVLHLVCDADREGKEVFSLGDERVTAPALAGTIRANAPALVLWSGGRRAGPVGPTLAGALLASVPALLCQRRSMPEELLVAYTKAFYRGLAAMIPVDAALTEARAAVLAQFPTDGEWTAPALFLSRKDATIVVHPSRGEAKDVYQISEGRYRRHLRESLNRFWPKPERYFPQLLSCLPRREPLASYLHAPELLGRPEGVAELGRRFQRLLLMGGPGSGKTMALYRLFYDAALPVLSYERKAPLPVYVALPDLGESEDLFERLVKGFDRDLFVSDLEEGRFLFLLDALDGLGAKGAARYVRALNQFMRRYPLNRFIATARGPMPEPVELPAWAEVLPLAEWEALDFLIADGAIRPEAARLLYTDLAAHLGPHVGNPQLLTLARRLWREGARIPATATGIFAAHFKIAGAAIAAGAREALLPQLAFFMSREHRLSLLRDHLQAGSKQTQPKGLPQLAEDLAFRSAGASGPDELLAQVEKTRLLRGPRAFTFPSLAFQEFLTAYSLRFAAPNTILGLIPSADWREVGDESDRPVNASRGAFHGCLPFVCGLREDGPALVEALISRDLVLASECFRECRRSTDADLALRAAFDKLLATRSDLDHRVGVIALESRGDAWALERLEELALEEGSPARALALTALGKLRSRRSVALLEAAAADRDPLVASAAVDALARIRAG